MWAMIGTCIALGIWTTGLLLVSTRAEKRRLSLSEEPSDTKEDTINAQKADGAVAV
jgi:hypothetical protein